jgi:hypothetical protein
MRISQVKVGERGEIGENDFCRRAERQGKIKLKELSQAEALQK